MKYLIIGLLNLYAISAYSQGTFSIDRATNRVSGFDATYTFTRSSVYDHDLRTYMDQTIVNTTVAVRIENDGGGRLIFFIREKVVFLVDSCVNRGGVYDFYLTNERGSKVTASLVTRENRVSSFWLDNPKENTSMVFYK